MINISRKSIAGVVFPLILALAGCDEKAAPGTAATEWAKDTKTAIADNARLSKLVDIRKLQPHDGAAAKKISATKPTK